MDANLGFWLNSMITAALETSPLFIGSALFVVAACLVDARLSNERQVVSEPERVPAKPVARAAARRVHLGSVDGLC